MVKSDVFAFKFVGQWPASGIVVKFVGPTLEALGPGFGSITLIVVALTSCGR